MTQKEAIDCLIEYRKVERHTDGRHDIDVAITKAVKALEQETKWLDATIQMIEGIVLDEWCSEDWNGRMALNVAAIYSFVTGVRDGNEGMDLFMLCRDGREMKARGVGDN